MPLPRIITAAATIAAILGLSACVGGGAGNSAIGRSAANVVQESQAEGGQQYTLGPQFESQLEEMISQEVVALGGKENVPMELNRQVLLNINYFLNDARGFMTRGLSRGSKYIPMMKNIFRQKGLPEDLVYLALIESGFKTEAVSHASAVGPWQFIGATGRRYGLTINEWVDERMDPVKSTYAAADYLTTLHDMFNSWPLAIAAYNSGEGKILKGMKNYGVSNFWDMTSVGGHLANETKLYVPSFLAATFIAKDPGAYGLEIDAQPPDKWDEVRVPAQITLKEAAKFSDSTEERLKELNPHLKKGATPPDQPGYALRIPAGSSDQFAKAYAKSGKGTAVASVTDNSGQHVVRRGETLESVAAKYGLTAKELGAHNNITKIDGKLKAGTKLALPQPKPPTRAAVASAVPPRAATAPPSAPAARKASIHTVASGENVGGIAKKYGLTAKELMALNNLKGPDIKIGQKLKVAAEPKPERSAPAAAKPTPPAKPTTHKVAAGENVGGIAKKYGLTAKELMTLNNLKSPDIRVGQTLKVGGQPDQPAKRAAVPAASGATHTVAAGESVGVIAEKYGMKSKDLMALNNLDGPNIRIGQKLKVAASPAGSAAAPAKPAAPPKTTAPAATSGTHTVAAGENVGVIAEKYGMKVKDLMALNNLDGPNIRIGQKLKVAGKPKAASAGNSGSAKVGAGTYKVAEGDTLYSIARKNNLSVDDLKKINSIDGNNVRVGQTLKLK